MTFAEDKAERRDAAAAERFPEDPAMERFLEWKRRDDPRFDKLAPAQRTALGYYERERRAARKAGVRTPYR